MSASVDPKLDSDEKKGEDKEVGNKSVPENGKESESKQNKSNTSAYDSANPPPMPKRPMSSTEKAIHELEEAFPNVEEKFVKMALIASEGRMDPAFNALLFISDPTSGVQVPSPRSNSRSGNSHGAAFDDSTRRQLESDEALAKRLARQYERGSSRRASERSGRRQSHGYDKNGSIPTWAKDDDSDRDELDDIYDSISKNVENVRTKFGSWVGGLAKKITPDEEPKQKSETPHLPSRSKQQLFSAFGADDTKYAKANAPPVPPKDDLGDRLSEKLAPIQLSNNTESSVKHDESTPKAEASSTEKLNAQSTADQTVKAAKKPAAEWKDLSAMDPEPVSDDKFIVDDSEEDETPIKKN